VKNHLYNMFAAMKNGQMAKRNFILINYKKICESFLETLWNEGYIVGYKKIRSRNVTKLKIFLKYKQGEPVINSLKLISKPAHKLYYSIRQIWKMNSTDSFIIFSTHQGLKSAIQCKKEKIGGEPLIMIN